jgi:hypothetical protein
VTADLPLQIRRNFVRAGVILDVVILRTTEDKISNELQSAISPFALKTGGFVFCCGLDHADWIQPSGFGAVKKSFKPSEPLRTFALTVCQTLEPRSFCDAQIVKEIQICIE